MSDPYIKAFQIRTTYGQIYYYEIDQLEQLDKFLQNNHLVYIAKISFYFNDIHNPTRNLILRQNTPNIFDPEFPTRYYDGYYIPALSEEEEKKDFNAVYTLLNNSYNLDDRIGKYIVNPYTNSNLNTNTNLNTLID
jgi:hypothetical protein